MATHPQNRAGAPQPYLRALAVLLRATAGLVAFAVLHPGAAAAIDPATGRVGPR